MERGVPTKTLFVVVGILALTLSLPMLTRASFATSGTSISLSYSVKTSGTQTTLWVTLSARDSQLPNYVVLSLASYFNGANVAYNSQSVTLTTTGSGSVSFTYTVPFQGNGNYLFVGGVSDTHGHQLLSASIDPFIKTGH